MCVNTDYIILVHPPGLPQCESDSATKKIRSPGEEAFEVVKREARNSNYESDYF